MSVYVIGLSHQTAPVELRERFAFGEQRIPSVLQALRQQSIADEAVIVSTCNRVELYVSTQQDPRRSLEALHEFLMNCHEYRETLSDQLYRFGEPQSVEHLFKVACGLDSMVLGETEILGQLKKAYDLALQSGYTGPILNKAFQNAFNVAKKVRTETNIQRGSVSVASAAVELAEKIFSSLTDRRVMVIGAGDTSEKAARALLSRGARSILVSNRSFDRAEALAKELGGRAVRFEDWSEEFCEMDIVISSTAAPHYILDVPKLQPLMARRKNAPLLLIDIAVPRDIDPAVNLLDNVYVYNVDDLQAIANDYMKLRRDEIARCEAIIRDRAQALLGARRPPQMPGQARPAFGHD